MSEMKQREYYCPTCGFETKTTTNHEGEIYSGCKNCSNSILYPVNDSREFTPMFRLQYYYFDLETGKSNGHDQSYEELVDELSNIYGYKKSMINVPYYATPVHNYSRAIEKLDNEIVTVNNPDSFNDQFITNFGRLRFWEEFAWDNKKIKTGFYLLPLE